MPIQNPCALLDRLLAEPAESPWLEFKANNDDPQLIGEYVSALANASMLAGQDRAYLVFGINDKTRAREGTKVRLHEIKKGGENLQNWLTRMVEPRLMLDFEDFECGGLQFSILAIEPTYDRPVRFSGTEYFRIGENKKKLVEFPEHERALWLAISNQSPEEIFTKLDTSVIFELKNIPEPKNPDEIIRRMVEDRFLIDNMEGGYDITNQGATNRSQSLSNRLEKATQSGSPA
jgi:ATP-dependent DNA helicase RecG